MSVKKTLGHAKESNEKSKLDSPDRIDSIIPSPFDLLGIATDYSRSVTDPLLRGTLEGTTLGLSEVGLGLTGVQKPEEGMLHTAGEIAGTLVPSTLLYKSMSKIPSIAKGLNTLPRTYAAGLGAVESGVIGATRTAVEGGDIDDVLMAGGIEGAAGGGLGGFISVLGYLAGRGVRYWGGPKTPRTPEEMAAQEKTRTAPYTLMDANFKQLNEGVIKIANDHGIPILPLAVKPTSKLLEFATRKARQVQSAQHILDGTKIEVDQAYQAWGRKITELVRSPTGQRGQLSRARTPNQPVILGDLLQDYYKKHIEGLRSKASDIYTDITKNVDASGWKLSKMFTGENAGAQLGRDLIDLIDNHGLEEVTDASANKVRNFVKKLNETNEDDNLVMSLSAIWNEAKLLYPKKKSLWGPGEFLAADAASSIRAFVRDKAEDISEVHGPLFKKADLWWKSMRDLEETTVGKSLRSASPELVINNLTKDISTMRETRAVLGTEFFNAIARQKLFTILTSRSSDGGALKKVHGTQQERYELTYDGFVEAMGALGAGKQGNVGNQYLDELLRDFPGARMQLKELENMLNVYSSARRSITPAMEALGGGTERITAVELVDPGTLNKPLEAISRMFSLLVHFSTGGRLGQAVTNPPATNPFVGGVMPPTKAALDVSKYLRRGLTATGLASDITGARGDDR